MTEKSGALQPPQGHSLDRLYDVNLEVDRLRELPKEFHGEYLDGQMIGLLNEHAGYVPHSEIEGTLTPDGRWNMQGLDLQESWQKTVEKYGAFSREYYEVVGYREADKLLQRPDIWMVVLSSPSKEGYNDRRFTFVLRKIANSDGSFRVIQTNIMHRHDDVDFDKAQQDYDTLQQEPTFSGALASPMTAEEMLVRPLAFNGSQDDEGRIFKLLGLTQDKVDQSAEFTQRVRRDLGAYVQHFIALMQDLSETDRSQYPHEYAQKTIAAKQARDYLFEQALVLREQQSVVQEDMSEGNLIDIRSRIAAHYSHNAAPLFYGSLVCDTEASNQYAYMIYQGMSPHLAAMYTTFGAMYSSESESWRDITKWKKGTCREFGKGGCGASDVKIGPCAVCEDCQKEYDKGRNPSVDRRNIAIAKAA